MTISTLVSECSEIAILFTSHTGCIVYMQKKRLVEETAKNEWAKNKLQIVTEQRDRAKEKHVSLCQQLVRTYEDFCLCMQYMLLLLMKSNSTC